MQMDAAMPHDALKRSDELFSERGNKAIYSATMRMSTKPEIDDWNRIVRPKSINSQKNTRKFLECLQYLPIGIQEGTMTTVEMEIMSNGPTNIVQGLFRGEYKKFEKKNHWTCIVINIFALVYVLEIPNLYGITVQNRKCFKVGNDLCEMLLIELSRFNSTSQLCELLCEENCKFYIDKEDFSIFATFRKEGKMFAAYPHTFQYVRMQYETLFNMYAI